MDPDDAPYSPRSNSRAEGDQHPPSKRAKTSIVPRKPACQTCRRRKVRCDNGRPACGFCHSIGTSCVYVTRGDDGKQDLDKVFERLDTLSRAVENIQSLLTSRDTPQPHWNSGTQPEDRPVAFPIRAADSQKDYLQIPACRCSADAVLTWPIFRGQFRENSLITTLFHSPHGGVEDRPTESWSLPEGLRFAPEEQIPALVDQFIQNVHTKNPILDLESLIRSGRHAAEFGLQWDAQSCLVLLACALGCISQPFTISTQEPQTARPFHENLEWRTPGFTSSSTSQLREGEAFFMMACKRIGLLQYSVIGAECHFFAGVYLMYTFRPLSAWNHFYQASTFYRLRLRLIDGLDKSAYERDQQGTSVAERFEQSLYWSCFKSEVEIRVELPLPQSAIAEYEYPALFPTPPTLSDDYPRHRDQMSDWTRSEDPLGSPDVNPSNLRGRGVCNHITKLFNEEQSWYYYLTEVALRRIGNRVLNAFYRDEPSTWSNIKPLIPMALEFESQINAWFANLPPAMQYYESGLSLRDSTQGFTDTQESISLELSWALSNRFLEIRLWLYQPFLYFAIHHPSGATSTAREAIPSPLANEEFAIVHGLVKSGLDCGTKILQARCLRHRHHGIWFDLRALVTASLIFIALARSDNLDLLRISPGGLRSHLHPTLEALTFWEDEAPDIKKARGVLDSLLRELS